MSADIWTPDSPPDQIGIYVDETYFDQNSGLIQVALPAPKSADAEFKKAVAAMVAGSPRFQHKEFKASQLNERNAEVSRSCSYGVELC